MVSLKTFSLFAAVAATHFATAEAGSSAPDSSSLERRTFLTGNYWCKYFNIGCDYSNIDTSTDVNNCGVIGHKCALSWAHGWGSQCVDGQCKAQECNTLFDWDWSLSACRDVSSDTNNCGSCGNTCSISHATSTTCDSGTCKATACKSGYDLKDGACEYAPDTNNDVNNCGALGFVCSFLNGSGKCENGSCLCTQCADGYELVGGECKEKETDDGCSACDFQNGSGTCYWNTCKYTSCDDGYSLQNNMCVEINTSSDPDNCGSLGNVCPKTLANGFNPRCEDGQCTGSCENGFDWDILGLFCRDVRYDTNNCGRCGNECSIEGASATTCDDGSCKATACEDGYELVSSTCKKIDLTCDPQHCGAWGNKCEFTPLGATGECRDSGCVYTSCPDGYYLSDNSCKTTPSQRARAKRAEPAEVHTLCPSGETACPIIGSAMFDTAVRQHFSGAADFGSGGFECLDTASQLDSCGGCASLGEGRDCTQIAGAVGVGCDNGACVVLSCSSGWRPNLEATECVRVGNHARRSKAKSLHARAIAHGFHGHGSI